MTAEQIFEKADFVSEYRQETESFYRPYFSSEEEMIQFFVSVFSDEDKVCVPRRMINQIRRFVSLANDIDSIRPGYDSLRITFLRICLESLCKLCGMSNKKSDFFNMFSDCFSKDGRVYIHDNFRLINLDPLEPLPETEHGLTVPEFLLLMRVLKTALFFSEPAPMNTNLLIKHLI